MTHRPLVRLILPSVLACSTGGGGPRRVGDSDAVDSASSGDSGTSGDAGSGDSGDSGSADTGGLGDSGSFGPVGDSGFEGRVAAGGADLSCFVPSATQTVWATQGAVTGAGVPLTVGGRIEDFESGEAITGRRLDVWFDADPAVDDPDFSGTVLADGTITLSGVPACTPLDWRTTETPSLDEAVPTYSHHRTLTGGGASTAATDLLSWSLNTHRLIPAVVGITLTPSNGSVLGRVLDCSRDPATTAASTTGLVEGARVRVYGCSATPPKPATCTAPLPGAQVRYATERFPDRDQPFTSADGLFLALDLPPGAYRIEAYDRLDGSARALGGTIVEVVGGSVHFADIWLGFADGLKYPEACLSMP